MLLRIVYFCIRILTIYKIAYFMKANISKKGASTSFIKYKYQILIKKSCVFVAFYFRFD